eukprot:XP_008178838.1 PREDICTED: uncharacterized protein LOC100571638 isoform X1 [Acyrthosiphon pisum]
MYKDRHYTLNNDWHDVVKKYVHEKYIPGTDTDGYDVCLLKLEKAIPNINKFSKIGGSPKDFSNGIKLNYIIIGFGMISDLNDDKNDSGMFGRITTVDVLHGEEAGLLYNKFPKTQKSWE